MELSAVIITRNEERNIGRCLASLKGIADDIVVLDSFSTDRTGAIVKEHGALPNGRQARFIQHAFDGHIEQKNRAITHALHPWVLSLDADEALDDRLAGADQGSDAGSRGGWLYHEPPDQLLRWLDPSWRMVSGYEVAALGQPQGAMDRHQSARPI